MVQCVKILSILRLLYTICTISDTQMDRKTRDFFVFISCDTVSVRRKNRNLHLVKKQLNSSLDIVWWLVRLDDDSQSLNSAGSTHATKYYVAWHQHTCTNKTPPAQCKHRLGRWRHNKDGELAGKTWWWQLRIGSNGVCVWPKASYMRTKQGQVKELTDIFVNISNDSDSTELFLCAENVEARLTDDLTEQLQQHVVVGIFNRTLVIDLQWRAFVNVVLLTIHIAAAYSTSSSATHSNTVHTSHHNCLSTCSLKYHSHFPSYLPICV